MDANVIEIIGIVITGVIVPLVAWAIQRTGAAASERAKTEAEKRWWLNMTNAAEAAVRRVESEIVEPAFEAGEMPDWAEAQTAAMDVLADLVGDVLTPEQSVTMIEAAYQRMVGRDA